MYMRGLSIYSGIYLGDSHLILMRCFWRQSCRNAFTEPIETSGFASISPGSLAPVPGLLVSGFQLKVLPQQRASCVSPGIMLFSIQLGLFIIIIIVWWGCLFFPAKPRHLSHKRLSNLAEEATFLDGGSEHLVSGYLSVALLPHPAFPGISSVQKSLWFAHHLVTQNSVLLRTSYVFVLVLNCSLEEHFIKANDMRHKATAGLKRWLPSK